MDMGAMLAGKRVLVTGASSGLGDNFARLAAGCKAKVVIAARRKARLDALAKELDRLGSPQVTVLEMDVSSEQSIDDAFAQIDASGDILDVVINNAGVSGEGMALKLPTREFDDLMAINVRGVWLVAVRAARRWQEAGRGGSIVNIASIQGERVMPGITPYSTSKAAVVHMTKSLALEWARYGIRVNAIEPGYIGTEMTDAMWERAPAKMLSSSGIARLAARRAVAISMMRRPSKDNPGLVNEDPLAPCRCRCSARKATAAARACSWVPRAWWRPGTLFLFGPGLDRWGSQSLWMSVLLALRPWRCSCSISRASQSGVPARISSK